MMSTGRMLVIPNIGPDSARARQLRVQHRDGRIVGLNRFRIQHPLFHQLVERAHQIGAFAHPVAHRLARQLHALAVEDFLLAVQGKVIAILAHRHVRQQPRPRQPSLNWRLRLLRRDHRASLRAGIFLIRFFDHHQRGRHVFKPLADFFPDPLQLFLALRTLPFIFPEIINHALSP
ncbi:MAG: hypothetical protein WB763_04775 [Terriglobia bacterium]|jgi:hypothetical protein